MSLTIRKTPDYKADVLNQVAWYFREADEEVARRFYMAADLTLLELSKQPGLGRVRRFRHPLLQGLRSFRVGPPFGRLILFYKACDGVIEAWRLMHGARNLARRLLEPSEL